MRHPDELGGLLCYYTVRLHRALTPMRKIGSKTNKQTLQALQMFAEVKFQIAKDAEGMKLDDKRPSPRSCRLTSFTHVHSHTGAITFFFLI